MTRFQNVVVLAELLFTSLGLAAPKAEAPPAPPSTQKRTVDDCVAIALRESGMVGEAKGKVTEWAGRLAEVESIFYPKLVGLTYVAPVPRLVGDPFGPTRYDYRSWGPYVRLQAILAQPIYTFGRAESGKAAAAERLKVEEARLQQTRNAVALEVRKMYYLHLFAQSMKPALELAKRSLDEAEARAKEMYKSGSGKVTNIDLQKLRFGATELEKYRVQAQIGAELALVGLKHTMGLGQDAPLELAEAQLPPPPEALPPLAELIQRAAEHRPEVAQLYHGEKAALALRDAERLSAMPTLFVAGQIDLNWTPMWQDQTNPFYWDRLNDITPGAAVGLQFDVDVAKSLAKSRTAHGTVEQVEGLKRFAQTGIPAEVRKAYDEAVQAQKLVKLSDEGATAGRKWLIFAGSGYATGTGDPKDLLEGLVAYLQAKKGYYENLQGLHVAYATLLYATGRTGVEGASK